MTNEPQDLPQTAGTGEAGIELSSPLPTISSYMQSLEETKDDLRKRAEFQKKEMAALCEDLHETLFNPSISGSMLDRQADLLECLLYTVMRRNFQNDLAKGNFNEDGIMLALRIQKQCAESLKAATTMEYMHSLNYAAHNYRRPYPHPPKIYEQTRKGTFDGTAMD